MNNKKSTPPPKTDFNDTKNQTEKLQSLQEKHNLTVSQIAKITGRKKLKTCEGWIDGTIPTPPRALAEVQAWVEKEYAKPDR